MTTPLPARITDVYPRYSHRLLRMMAEDYEGAVVEYLDRTNRGHYQFQQMFAHEPINFKIGPKDVVISGSLFFKPSSFSRNGANPALDANGQILLEDLYKVPHPTFMGSKRESKCFFDHYVKPILDGAWEPFKCVIFLASDLRCLIPILHARGIKVVMMKHPGISHNPGAMWRYLAFNFKCRAVYFADTDREFQIVRVKRLLRLLKLDEKTALARPLQATGNGAQMALILGNNFLVRPALVDFDVAESMRGYITLNMLTEDRATVFSHEPRHGRSGLGSSPSEPGYSGARPDERVPFKCFPYYGFDEQWLKEVVYYHFSDGRMATQVTRFDPNDVIQSLDLQYQQENGNRIVWPAESNLSQA